MKLEYETELYHHGIRGMKWYRRRFQNEDGSYTAAGRARYGIGQAMDRARSLGDRARNAAGQYGQNALNSARNLGGGARRGLATAGVIAGLGTANAALDTYRAVEAARRNGGRAINAAGDRATEALNRAANTFGNRAKEAAATGLAARNLLALRGQDIANRAGNAARSTSNEMREILKAYGKDISGNARNLESRARDAAGYARTAAGVYGLEAMDRARNLGNRARDAAGYARTAAGVAGLDAMDRARNLGSRARDVADLARGAGMAAARTYGNRAREAAGAYGRNALDRARTGLSVAGVAGLDAMDSARSLGNRARNVAGEAGRGAMERVRDGLGTAGAVGLASLDVARNGLQNARGAAGALGQRYFDAAKQRAGNDPYKFEKFVTPVQARMNSLATNALLRRRGEQQPQQNETARPVADSAAKQAYARDRDKYAKAMMDDLRDSARVNQAQTTRASYQLNREGYGGQLPYKLQFGKETVTSNPMRDLYTYNNPTSHLKPVLDDEEMRANPRLLKTGSDNPYARRLTFGNETYKYAPERTKTPYDVTNTGSDADRALSYREHLQAQGALRSPAHSDAYNRMAEIERQMNAYRDNRARHAALNAGMQFHNVMGKHTNYLNPDYDARRNRERSIREANEYADTQARVRQSASDRSAARDYAIKLTPSAHLETGRINTDAFSKRLDEIRENRARSEARNTKIPAWVKEQYGTNQNDIPEYIWEALKKRRQT